MKKLISYSGIRKEICFLILFNFTSNKLLYIYYSMKFMKDVSDSEQSTIGG
jgi:hypothetical protein